MPRFLIPLFALGTVFGFASGFHHLHEYRQSRWAAEEQHLADLCAQSALNAQARGPAGLGVVGSPPPWALGASPATAVAIPAPSAPAAAPVQQISQAPAPVIIYAPAPYAPAPAPALAQPAAAPSVIYLPAPLPAATQAAAPVATTPALPATR